MRTFIKALLAVTVLSLSPVAHAEAPRPLSAYEGPALSDSQLREAVAYVEKTVKLPEGAEPFGAYARYYAQKKGIIYAEYVVPYRNDRNQTVHIVPYDQLPGIADGGCSVIDVIYIPGIKLIDAKCHGHG